MRDKLIELIKSGTGINHNGKCDICQTADCIGCLADYLIDHGVTVQKWIPVEERLPELNERVLVRGKGKEAGFEGDEIVAITERYLFRFLPSSPGTEIWRSPWQYFHSDYEITHWMELPEPPKEDNNAGD